MKNVLSFALAIGFVGLFSACQKNNYVQTIPAPKFEYVKSEKKTITQPLAVVEEVTEAPVLEADAETSLPAEVIVSTAPVAEAASTKMMKEVATTTSSTPQKMTFKQRMVSKVVAKRLEKMTKPKAGQTNKIALIAGIAGIASLIFLFIPSVGVVSLLLALAAIIMGFVGRAQIKRDGGTGNGWAITGIVAGFLVFFLVLLGVLLVASLLGGIF
ncbi:MAG: DUF4190 domain-containing protein [Runella sp.]